MYLWELQPEDEGIDYGTYQRVWRREYTRKHHRELQAEATERRRLAGKLNARIRKAGLHRL